MEICGWGDWTAKSAFGHRDHQPKNLRSGSCFLWGTRKGERGQRTDHDPLHCRKRRLDNQIVRDRCHYVLGSDRQRRETPREYGTEYRIAKSARQEASVSPREGLLIDPGKEECLDQHGKKTKLDDYVLPIDCKAFVIAVEQNQVPDESERKSRREVSEHSKSEAHLHFCFLFLCLVLPFAFGGNV